LWYISPKIPTTIKYTVSRNNLKFGTSKINIPITITRTGVGSDIHGGSIQVNERTV